MVGTLLCLPGDWLLWEVEIGLTLRFIYRDGLVDGGAAVGPTVGDQSFSLFRLGSASSPNPANDAARRKTVAMHRHPIIASIECINIEMASLQEQLSLQSRAQ